MSYTVINAMKTGEFDSQYGKKFKYAVQFDGVDGAVEVAQKPETPAPKPGDVLEGTIEDTQYGKRFKKALGSSGGFSGGRSTSAEDRGSIERQTALKAAVEAVSSFYMHSGAKPVDQATYATEVVIMAKTFAGFAGNAAPQTTIGSTSALPTVDDLPPITAYEQ